MATKFDMRKGAATAFKIIIASLIVGFILDMVKIDPLGFLRMLSNALHDVAELAGDAVRWAIPYIILGAVVVVPYYLICFGIDYLKNGRGR